jgi:hypothetical protein
LLGVGDEKTLFYVGDHMRGGRGGHPTDYRVPVLECVITIRYYCDTYTPGSLGGGLQVVRMIIVRIVVQCRRPSQLCPACQC